MRLLHFSRSGETVVSVGQSDVSAGPIFPATIWADEMRLVEST
jgi:hypothetical protein